MVDEQLYHTWDELIAEFDALTIQHPGLIEKSIIGVSTNGKQIPVYLLGNPNGGRICFTTTHGNELCGPECYLRYAKWLLENKEPGISDRQLARNYIAIVPHINPESYKSTRYNQGRRKNPRNVDLNRNFEASWRIDCVKLCVDCCGGNHDCAQYGTDYQCIGVKAHYECAATGGPWDETCEGYPDTTFRKRVVDRLGNCYKKGCSCYWSDFPADYNYRGEAPLSEAESAAMRAFIETFQPKAFLDYHQWAGPWIGKASWRGRNKAVKNGWWPNSTECIAAHDTVNARIQELAIERGAKKYGYTSLGVCGGHADDACAFAGAVSYLIEGHNYKGGQCPYADIDSRWFPAFLPIAMAFCEYTEIATPEIPHVFSHWLVNSKTTGLNPLTINVITDTDIVAVYVPLRYVFSHWLVNGKVACQNPITLDISYDTNIVAVYVTKPVGVV